jgi:ArsR family transcriptional regulator, arsenate/arsenite/antimonite-responsive transcriptional repressor
MQLTQATAYFKALGEPMRLRLMHLLVATHGLELCNCELVDALEEPQPNISRHLKILSQAGLIHERHDGRWVYYRCATEAPAVATLTTVCATLHDPVAQDDLRRLHQRLTLRQEGKCVLGVQKRHLLSGLTLSEGGVVPRDAGK